MRTTRRGFLRSSLILSSQALLGCGSADSGAARDETRGDGGSGACPDPFTGGQRLGTVPFVGDDGTLPMDTLVGQGWDARLYTDLSTVDEAAPRMENDRFYVRTAAPDGLDPSAPWVVRTGGLARRPRDLDLATFLGHAEDQGVHVLECSGNGRRGGFGLLGAARWGGAPVDAILTLLEPDPAATRVLIAGFDEHSVPSAGGHSTPGASWIFTFAELAEAGAFFATEMNGEPLPPHHGAPVRLFVPGWYGCTAIKWVNAIELVDDSAPATSQMIEFASRTHQPEAFELAKDYLPATMDQAAMPIRVERWQLDGRLGYRVVGLVWGGHRPTHALEIRFGDGPWQPVDVCPPQTQNQSFTPFSHHWLPAAPGTHAITCRIADPSVPTRRLDMGYYLREVRIDAV